MQPDQNRRAYSTARAFLGPLVLASCCGAHEAGRSTSASLRRTDSTLIATRPALGFRTGLGSSMLSPGTLHPGETPVDHTRGVFISRPRTSPGSH